LTALHIAAMWGRKEVIQELLAHGAEPQLSDYDGMLPVDYANEEGMGLKFVLL